MNKWTVTTRGALLVNKPKTTTMVIIPRWLKILHTIFSYSTYSRRHSIGYRRRSASLWLVRQDQANTFGQSAILRLRLWEMIGVDTICCSCNWTSWLSSLRLWWQQTESWAESCSALTASSALRCFTRWHCSTNNCFSSACSTHQHTVSHPHTLSITLWYRHSRWT